MNETSIRTVGKVNFLLNTGCFLAKFPTVQTQLHLCSNKPRITKTRIVRFYQRIMSGNVSFSEPGLMPSEP